MTQLVKQTLQMIQSMKILQLPITELKKRIDQEMSENPLLEEPFVETEAPEVMADGAAGDADGASDPSVG